MSIEEMFDLMEEMGLNTTDNESISYALNKCKIIEIQEIAYALSACINKDVEDISTPYQFVASGGLSGTQYPCAALPCRLERVGALAQFSTLYADVVYISDPFSILFDNGKNHKEFYAEEFTSAIIILNLLKPLLLKRIIRFSFRDSFHVCSDCIERHFTEKGVSNALKIAYEYLEGRFKNEVVGSVVGKGKDLSVLLSGPSRLLKKSVAPPTPA